MVTLARPKRSACIVLRESICGVTSVYSIDSTETARFALIIR